MNPGSIRRALLFAWLTVFLLFGLLTVTTYPPVNYNLGDEVWAMQSSLEFVEGDYHAGMATPRLYFAAMGYYQKLFGEGIMAARIFSLLAATGVLYMTFLLGREVENEDVGLVASVVLGTTFAFTWHSRVIRSEMLTALFVVAAVCLLCYAYRRQRHWAVLPGSLLAALSVYVHPNSLQYALGIIPLFVALFRKKLLSSATVYFVLGLAGGFSLWLFTVYLPTRGAQSAADMLRGVAGVAPFPILNRPFPELLFESIRSLPGDYISYTKIFDIFFPNSISVTVLASATVCVWALSAVTDQGARVLSIVGLAVLANLILFFITDKYGYWHMVELYPFFALSVALGLYGLRQRLRGRLGAAAMAAGVLFFAGIGTADTALTYMKFRGYDYGRFTARVAEKVDGRVLAVDLYGPAFKREDFVKAWFDIERPRTNCPPIGPKVKELGVRYIIADSLLRAHARRSCGRPYEQDFIRYLYLHARLVDTIGQKYPNYWADGRMISETHVFKIP